MQRVSALLYIGHNSYPNTGDEEILLEAKDAESKEVSFLSRQTSHLLNALLG